jgi:hypothetical protein
MRLQSETGTMVVDYYPCKMEDGRVSPNFLVKVVRFRGIETMSTSVITRKKFVSECQERIGIGYNVVDFNTVPRQGNPMAGAC